MRNQTNIGERDGVAEAAFSCSGSNYGLDRRQSGGDPGACPFGFGVFLGFSIAFSQGGDALQNAEVLYGLRVAANDAANL